MPAAGTLPPPIRVGKIPGNAASKDDLDLTQIQQELAGQGAVDIYEVRQIVGAQKLRNGEVYYAVVWAKDNPIEGGTWEPAANHAVPTVQKGQSLLVQWELSGKRKRAGACKAHCFWAEASGDFDGARQAHFVTYKNQKSKTHTMYSKGHSVPIKITTDSTAEDEHWLNLSTLAGNRMPNGTGSKSRSVAGSDSLCFTGELKLRSWVLQEYVGSKFIYDDDDLALTVVKRHSD